MKKACYSHICHWKNYFFLSISPYLILNLSSSCVCHFLLRLFHCLFCFEFGPYFLLFLIILCCLPALAIFSPWHLNPWKYVWKVSTFCFFCLLNLTYWFFRKSPTYLLLFLMLLQHITAHSGLLKIWQIISSTTFRKTCPFPSIVAALICTLSCCAVKA